MAPPAGQPPDEVDFLDLLGDDIDNERYWDASEHFENEEVLKPQPATSGSPVSASVSSSSVSALASVPASASVLSASVSSGSPTLVSGSASVSSGSGSASVSSGSPSASVSSGSASRLPSHCSSYLHNADSTVWDKLPADLVTDTPEASTLVMDPAELRLRKEKFGKLILAFLRYINAELVRLSVFSGTTDWTLVPISFFSSVFLSHVSEKYFVGVILDNTLDEFIYITHAPDFTPKDLLNLPRWSKQSNQWGIYVDLLTNEKGEVVAWYFGSALSKGSKSAVCGAIARILSYYSPGSFAKKILHQQWIEKDGIIANFRQVYILGPQHSWLHRVWSLAAECFFIMAWTLDTTRRLLGKFASAGLADFVNSFRQENGLPSFDSIEGLNRALPLKQGVAPDPRFAKKTCCNPVANCPAGTDVYPMNKWRNVNNGEIFTGRLLCTTCWQYKKDYKIDRPQHLIDLCVKKHSGVVDPIPVRPAPARNLGSTDRASAQGTLLCQWCFRYHVSSMSQLKSWKWFDNIPLCSFCGDAFTAGSSKLPPPIPGLHFDASHRFECKDPECTKTDKSLALAWFFRATKDNTSAQYRHTGYTLGDIRCEECNYRYQPDRQLKGLLGDPDIVPHKLGAEDLSINNLVNRYSRAGYLEYCRRFLNVDLTGQGNASSKASALALRQSLIDGTQTVDIRARDSFFDETSAKIPTKEFGKMHWLLPEDWDTLPADTNSALDDDSTLLEASSSLDNTLVEDDDSIESARKGKKRAAASQSTTDEPAEPEDLPTRKKARIGGPRKKAT